MIVSAWRGNEVVDVAINPTTVILQLHTAWLLNCGQKLGDRVGKCGYWQRSAANWQMENIRLATKEEIKQSQAFAKMIEITHSLED